MQDIEYLHNLGLMSDQAYYQQNGKSIIDNYIMQQRKMHIKQTKRKIYQQLFEALNYALNESTEKISDAAAAEIINSVHAAFDSGSSGKKGKRISSDLGTVLGRALGQAPFKAIDELLNVH